MAEFYAWETVDLNIKVSDKSALEDYDKIVISLEQGRVHLDFFDQFVVDSEEGIIVLHLTQKDTSCFEPNRKVKLQVNFYYIDEERDTSTEAEIDVLPNLYRKVIT